MITKHTHTIKYQQIDALLEFQGDVHEVFYYNSLLITLNHSSIHVFDISKQEWSKSIQLKSYMKPYDLSNGHACIDTLKGKLYIIVANRFCILDLNTFKWNKHAKIPVTDFANGVKAFYLSNFCSRYPSETIFICKGQYRYSVLEYDSRLNKIRFQQCRDVKFRDQRVIYMKSLNQFHVMCPENREYFVGTLAWWASAEIILDVVTYKLNMCWQKMTDLFLRMNWRDFELNGYKRYVVIKGEYLLTFDWSKQEMCFIDFPNNFNFLIKSQIE